MTTNQRTIATAAALGLTLLSLGCGAKGESRDRQGVKPAVAVEVAPATAATLNQAIEVVGTLEPEFFADVKSEFTAVVEEVYVTQWVHVDKGTPLAKLDTREADATLRAAKASALQAEVSAARARRELERAVKLKESGLLTQQGLDDARSADEAAQASAQAVAAQFAVAQTRLAKAVIRSPMDGDRRLARGQRRRPRREHGQRRSDVPHRRQPRARPDRRRSRRRAPRRCSVGQALEFNVRRVPGPDVHRAR